MTKTKPIQLLIDGDVILYQVLLRCEQETHWGNDLWTMVTDLKEAKGRICESIATLESDLGATMGSIVAFSCKTEDGFRRLLNPDYKLNRKDSRKPMGFNAAKQWMRETYACDERPTLEADDILGILSTEPSEATRVIVSIDKDFYSVPGFFCRTTTSERKIEQITTEQADLFFALQTLAGDPVDGFSGVPSVGMKTAEKLLKDVTPANYWEAIVAAYEKKGLTEDDALMNARMARILRYTDLGHLGNWTPDAEGGMV